jgi:hypothetical protein
VKYDPRVIVNFDNPYTALRKDLEDLRACYVDMVGDETMRKCAEKSLLVVDEIMTRITRLETAETLGNAISGGSR